MIPPRLRLFLARTFIHDVTATRGPRIGRRSISWHTGETHTANISGVDLRSLERKGLIEFDRLDHMSAMWGCAWFRVKITEQGKEEIADEYARRCAEADEQNARLSAPPEPADEIDEKREGMADRAEARARQRAAKQGA